MVSRTKCWSPRSSVVEVEADDLKSLEFAIVENVQRNDLNPIEEAKDIKD